MGRGCYGKRDRERGVGVGIRAGWARWGPTHLWLVMVYRSMKKGGAYGLEREREGERMMGVHVEQWKVRVVCVAFSIRLVEGVCVHIFLTFCPLCICMCGFCPGFAHSWYFLCLHLLIDKMSHFLICGLLFG